MIQIIYFQLNILNKDLLEIFKSIDIDFFVNIKNKNPDLKTQVKKVRKIPEIKYIMKKYRMSDAGKKSIFKTFLIILNDETKSESTTTLNNKNNNQKKKIFVVIL